MLRSQFRVTSLLFIILFSASCANSQKRGFAGAQKSKPSALQIQSPLSNDQTVIQELTGKAVSQVPPQEQLKNKPLSTQHYYAGVRAAESKNYILAIKHFNTVLKNYPRSNEVKLAFTSKAKVYKEMGLNEPAQLNLKMAQGQKLKLSPLRSSRSSASAAADTQSTGQGKTKIKR